MERIPNSCSDSPNRILLRDRKVLVNISMAYYRVNISAYNQAGESPQAIYIVPDFSATGTYHSFIRAMGKFYEQSVIYLLSVFGTGLSIS